MTPPAGARRILLIEDDLSIRQTLRYNLDREGYQVEEADTGTGGIEAARHHRPDLILLDVMLPGMNGIEVCRVLRGEMTVPIIMLTAKGHETDKVVGLRIGADDYVTKPFSLNELLARIEAALRRADTNGPKPPAEEAWGIFSIDWAGRRVYIQGEELRLSPKEFDLLSLFTMNPGRALSRAAIIQRVWGSKFYGDHKTVDVHVRWLREKFEPFPDLPFAIATVHGVGYRLDRRDAAD